MLYMQRVKSLKDWDGQSPPVKQHQKGETIVKLDTENDQKLPFFGPYNKKRERLEAAKLSESDLIDPSVSVEIVRETVADCTSQKISDVIRKAVEKIDTYSGLDSGQQVVAIVDENMCINCGKCYRAYNDSGYQATEFDSKTHLPQITDHCTGCAICYSVCPIPECIAMVPKTFKHKPNRGIPFGQTLQVSEIFSHNKIFVSY